MNNVYFAASAAILFLLVAVVMITLMMRHRTADESGDMPCMLTVLFRGESLTPKGMNYRIVVFIALMFAIMNLLATVFIYIAAQTQA